MGRSFLHSSFSVIPSGFCLSNLLFLYFFQVVSRGRILSHNTTNDFDGMFKSWSFRVSPEMSPSARLIGYYIDSNERVVADSILLKIDDKLPTEVTKKKARENVQIDKGFS